MCINRRRLIVKGVAVNARCNRCAECISDRVRDLTGRCYAEQMYSKGSHCITLTYGKSRLIGGARDVDGANVLDYTHVQDYLKRIRSAGHPVRFICAGEYGSRKGRAHWHVILYWQDKVPQVPEHSFDANGKSQCWDDPFWKFGHTHWDEVSPTTVKYLCKYLFKQARDPHAQAMMRRSTVPMLGAAYFDHWAKLHVEQQLPFRRRIYTIPGSNDGKTGKPWQYYFGDNALKYVIKSYVHQWTAAYSEEPPHSDLVDNWLDSVSRPEVKIHGQPFVRRSRPHDEPPPGYRVRFDEARNRYVAEVVTPASGPVLFWSYGPDGLPAWGEHIVSESEGRQRRRERYSASDGGDVAYREASQSSMRKQRRSRGR